MARTLEERIDSLLDQLEDPTLSSTEIEKIQAKIDYLNSLDR